MKKLNRISKRLKRKSFYKKAEETKTIHWDDIPKDIQEELIYSTEEFLSEVNSEVFQEDCEMAIEEHFPNSDIGYNYRLSYSQGDGFGVYGEINLEDALNLTNIKLSDLEKEMLYLAIDNHDIEINNNRRSPFFYESMIYLAEAYDKEYINEMLEDYFSEEERKDFDVDSFCNKIKTIEDKLREFLSDFCDKLENDGYDLIYPSEEEIINNIIENGDTVEIDDEEYQIIK